MTTNVTDVIRSRYDSIVTPISRKYGAATMNLSRLLFKRCIAIGKILNLINITIYNCHE